jgi:hypothetical protein
MKKKSQMKANQKPNESEKKPLGNGDGDDVLKEGGVGETEPAALLPKMFTIWKTSNPTYPPIPDKDLPALLEIAQFIAGKKGIEHLNGQLPEFMKTWDAWCTHIRGSTLKNKSLDSIAKFHLQEISQKITNGDQQIHKPPTGSIGAKQRGAHQLLESLRKDIGARGNAGNTG